MRNYCLGAWLLSLTLVLTGCQPTNKESASKPTAPDPEIARLMEGKETVSSPTASKGEVASAADIIPPPPEAAVPSSAPVTIDVRTVDFQGFDAEISSLRGKWVVIDCWATWCSICKDKFPKFMELQKKYADRTDVVFASLANDPEEKIDDVKEFLTKAAPALVCYLLDEDPADFSAKFQVDGVPAYLVFSADGTIMFKAGKIEELDAKLDELLKPQS